MPDCGTRSSYAAGCRCPRCRTANASYQRDRRDDRARSRLGTGMVPAKVVVEHLRALEAAGVGLRTVASASSVSRDQLARIRSGTVASIQRRTAQAVLAVPAVPAAGGLVDAGPSRRWMSDLLAAGWSPADIASGMGRTGRSITIGHRRVRASTHLALAGMWDRECRRRPHGTLDHYRQGCRCSRCRSASASDRADHRAGRAGRTRRRGDVAGLYDDLADVVRTRSLPWRSDAACAHLPVWVMVPLVEPDASVLAVCTSCPVRTECADARRGSAGIWGGVWYEHDERAP